MVFTAEIHTYTHTHSQPELALSSERCREATFPSAKLCDWPTKPVGRGCKRGWKDNPGHGFSPLAAVFAFHVAAGAVGSAASHIQGICTPQDGSHSSLGSLSASARTQRFLPPTHNLAESHTSLLLNCQSTTQAISVLTFKFVLLRAIKQS